MAVRAFDLTESQSPRLTVVEEAPRRRQDVRRSRQMWMTVGVVGMAVPFAVALVVVGVVH